MKKRADAPDEICEDLPTPKNTKKPVIVYVTVLFIAAFAMILLSFMMTNRSNEQMLGKLQSSVDALEQLQQVETRNIQLQKDLASSQAQAEKLQKQVDDLQKQLDSANAALAQQTPVA